ncbi:hypothetical protein GBAR_LOCUS8502 [Geodia barretti]|uniref:Ig-like domain-containing protein n=1 Tax=Geodia barretti TaxID=519541 RepID=A0AA35RNB4_GEOBA|nr:hypothetical protein GBAR_LOCUS8502 [Geodia barretti]
METNLIISYIALEGNLDLGPEVFLEQPKNATVQELETAVFRCSIINTSFEIYWRLNDSDAGHSKFDDIGYRVVFPNRYDHTVSRMEIAGRLRNNNTIVHCAAVGEEPVLSWTDSERALLIVQAEATSHSTFQHELAHTSQHSLLPTQTVELIEASLPSQSVTSSQNPTPNDDTEQGTAIVLFGTIVSAVFSLLIVVIFTLVILLIFISNKKRKGVFVDQPERTTVNQFETATFRCSVVNSSFSIFWLVNNSDAAFTVFRERGFSIKEDPNTHTKSQLKVAGIMNNNNTQVYCAALQEHRDPQLTWIESQTALLVVQGQTMFGNTLSVCIYVTEPTDILGVSTSSLSLEPSAVATALPSQLPLTDESWKEDLRFILIMAAKKFHVIVYCTKTGELSTFDSKLLGHSLKYVLTCQEPEIISLYTEVRFSLIEGSEVVCSPSPVAGGIGQVTDSDIYTIRGIRQMICAGFTQNKLEVHDLHLARLSTSNTDSKYQIQQQSFHLQKHNLTHAPPRHLHSTALEGNLDLGPEVFLEQPKNATVQELETAVFRCSIINTSFEIYWRLNDSDAGHSKFDDIGYRVVFPNRYDHTVSRMEIAGRLRNNNTIVHCAAVGEEPVLSWTDSERARLIVQAEATSHSTFQHELAHTSQHSLLPTQTVELIEASVPSQSVTSSQNPTPNDDTEQSTAIVLFGTIVSVVFSLLIVVIFTLVILLIFISNKKRKVDCRRDGDDGDIRLGPNPVYECTKPIEMHKNEVYEVSKPIQCQQNAAYEDVVLHQ